MYHSKLEDEQIDGLFVAIQQLETKEEFYRFFEDISTVSEITIGSNSPFRSRGT